jgi:regulator of cell morphogenesis and NO signaling
MMANYIGRDMGPIAVMEYEHNQAKAHISYFLEHTKTIAEDITLEKTKELAQHVINAYNILTDHFYKEENVLFPMAEQMLTAEEKTELAVQIASI